MANQPWICPEDGTQNTGNYCSHCGRQRPKYAANASDNSSKSGNSHPLRNFVIAAVAFCVCYGVSHTIVSHSTDSTSPTVSPSALLSQTSTPIQTAPVYDIGSEDAAVSYDWNWTEATIREGSSVLTVSAAEFTRTLYNVKGFTVHMDVEMYANTSCKDWQVWIRRNGSYEKAGKIYLPNGKGEVTQAITLSSSTSFDAIAITPTIPGGYSWSMSLGFSDFRMG